MVDGLAGARVLDVDGEGGGDRRFRHGPREWRVCHIPLHRLPIRVPVPLGDDVIRVVVPRVGERGVRIGVFGIERLKGLCHGGAQRWHRRRSSFDAVVSRQVHGHHRRVRAVAVPQSRLVGCK